mmetsp:Transcript_63766/g.93365  ORF Transcript_63766/g.93365 Transcript_63766/m.93365 type:complete len:166 (+) Transcript_63766:1952-2449(+)
MPGSKRKRDGEEGSESGALKSPRPSRPGDEGYDPAMVDVWRAAALTKDQMRLLEFYCTTSEPAPLTFELKVTAEGPPHKRTFTADAIVDGTSLAVASAPKKKLAQIEASAAALIELKVDIEALVQKYLELNPPKPRRSAAGAEDKGRGEGEGAEVVSEAEEEEAA